MNILKKVFLLVAFILLIVSSIFVLQLLLGEEKIIFTLYILISICFLVIICGIYQLITGKSIFKRFKGRKNGLALITSSLVLAILITVSTLLNIFVYESVGKNYLSFNEKILAHNKNISILSNRLRQKKYINDLIKKMNKESYKNLNLYYYEGFDNRPIEVIKNSLENLDQTVNYIFGDIDKREVNIIFHNEEKSYKKIIDDVNLNHVGGYYQPATGVHMSSSLKEQSDSSIEILFRHEYAHHIFHQFVNQNKVFAALPAWFEEGITSYIEREGSWEYDLSYIKDPVKLEEIETSEEFNKLYNEITINPDGWYDPYMHGYYVIDYLIKEIGKESVKEVILKSKNMSFYDAFELVIGIDINEFQEKTLIKYIEKNRGKL